MAMHLYSPIRSESMSIGAYSCIFAQICAYSRIIPHFPHMTNDHPYTTTKSNWTIWGNSQLLPIEVKRFTVPPNCQLLHFNWISQIKVKQLRRKLLNFCFLLSFLSCPTFINFLRQVPGLCLQRARVQLLISHLPG